MIVRTNGLDPIARSSPERWFTGGYAAAQPAITEWAVQMVRTTDPGCYISACEALAAFDVRGELGRVGVPTLVLVGSDDQVTGPAEARTLVAGIPDARLAVVPGASHLVPVEQPAAVTDLLVRHFTTAWQAAHDATSTGQVPVPVHSTAHQVPVPAAGIPAAPVQPVPAAPSQAAPIAEIGPAPVVPPQTQGRPDPYDAGLKVRREVLGDGHVDQALAQADEFSGDFQEFLTRYAWGDLGPAGPRPALAQLCHPHRPRRRRPPGRAGAAPQGRPAQRPHPGRDQGSAAPGGRLLRGAGRERRLPGGPAGHPRGDDTTGVSPAGRRRAGGGRMVA